MNTGLPAVFLDRDGVINADRPDFVKAWDEFEFLPSSLDALAVLAQSPFKVVMVTNQSGVGRGLLTEATLEEIHARMLDRIRKSGGRIDAIYYCPHAPEVGCHCRKPRPELFQRAARDLHLDLASCWSIGDSQRDVEAASQAGVKSVLIDRMLADPTRSAGSSAPYRRAANLRDAVRVIFELTPCESST